MKSGPSQDQPVADNVGDTQYAIDADSFDRYPLWTSAGIDYVVIVDGPNGTDGESPSDVTVGFNFTVDVWAAGYNSTLGYVMDVEAAWSVTNSSGATASITNTTGFSTTFNSGSTEGLSVLTAIANGTMDQVNATIAMFQPDIVIDGVGNGIYENPPTAAQQIHKWVAPAGSMSYVITLQNDGNATETIAFVWDISALPIGWTASMFNEDTGTDITADMNDDGMSWFVNMTKGGMANLTLTLNATAGAVVGEYATIGLGFFSTASNANDSFGVSAIIPGVDSIVLTDSPDGTALGPVNMASLGNVTAYASAYNSTWGYLGLISVDWSCTPVVGTFTNATGTSTTFTAGWTGGWANITGTSSILTDSFAIFFSGDVTDPVSACNVTGGYWHNSLPLTITATASDSESGLAQVRLWYAYSVDNVTFGAYQIAGTDTAAPWSFTFDFPAGEGYYRFYSQATDAVGNPEAVPASPDVRYGYDVTDPAVNAGLDVIDNGQFTQDATTSDLTSGIANYTWAMKSGPGTIIFGSQWSEDTTIQATVDGTYIINLNVTDNAGNQNRSEFTLVWDTIGPETSIMFGEPNYPESRVYNNTWYNFTYINSTTPITLSAADAGSGVSEIWYRLGLITYSLYDLHTLEIHNYSIVWTNWTEYMGAFTIPTNQYEWIIGYIEFYSTDLTGLAGELGNVTVYVEAFAPTVALTISNPNSGLNPTYITSGTMLNLTADDYGDSGVAGIWYNIDGGSWINYTGSFNIIGAGGHNISYYAMDNLGQNSTVITKYVWLDEITPTTGREISGPHYGQFINANTLIYLNSTDSGSGVSVIQYRINGGAWLNYTGPLNFSVDGTYLIEYHAIDNVHNSEPLKEIELIVENALPVPGHSITGPSYASPNGIWYITSQTNISLLADDVGSGVAEIWYSLDNGTWTLFASAFDLAPGLHEIQYYAEDNLGHASAVMSLSLFHDDLPPVIYFLGPSPDDGVIRIESGGMISLSASDTGVGVEAIYYSLDGGVTWMEYTELLPFTESGTLMCRSLDVLGNMGDTVTVTIEIISDDDGGMNFWWIIIILIIGVIGGILGYWLISKRGSRPPEEPIEEEAGSDDDGDALPPEGDESANKEATPPSKSAQKELTNISRVPQDVHSPPRAEALQNSDVDLRIHPDGHGCPSCPHPGYADTRATPGTLIDGTPTQGGPQARGNSPTHVGSGPKPNLSDLPKNTGDDAGVINPTVTPPGNLPPVPSATLEVKKPGSGP